MKLNKKAYAIAKKRVLNEQNEMLNEKRMEAYEEVLSEMRTVKLDKTAMNKLKEIEPKLNRIIPSGLCDAYCVHHYHELFNKMMKTKSYDPVELKKLEEFVNERTSKRSKK